MTSLEKTYCPEMGQAKPAAEIDARYMPFATKFRLRTNLTLSGRGIKFEEVHNGRNVYAVTLNAYAKLEQKHTIARVEVLD